MSHNITKGSILSLASNVDVYNRGETYYRNGKILSVSSADEAGQEAVTMTVEGNYRNYTVQLIFDAAGQLSRSRCDCDSASIWRGACKHVVAGLFALLEGGAGRATTYRMDYTVSSLTNMLEKQIFFEIDESLALYAKDSADTDHRLRLTPHLHMVANNDAYVDFTLGAEKQYIIRDLDEFTLNIANQRTVSYGAKLKFRHSRGVFDADSQKYLDFIQNESAIRMEAIQTLAKRYYISSAVKQKRNFLLSERNTDVFFALLTDSKIDTQSGVMTITDELPPLDFRLECQRDQAILYGKKLNYRLLTGQQYMYFFIYGVIYRLPVNFGKSLATILAGLDDLPEPVLVFRDQNKTTFLSVILPHLKKLKLIQQITGDVEQTPGSPMYAKLYFDAQGKDVVCKAFFCYDDVEINPLRQSNQVVPRDIGGEYKIQRHLALYGFEPDEQNEQYILEGDGAVFRFMSSGLDDIKNNAELFATDALKRQVSKTRTPTVGVRIEGNLLTLRIQHSEFSFSELLDALESVRAKKKYHRLKDGRFFNLQENDFQETAELIGSLDLSKKELSGDTATLPMYRALYLDQLIEKNNNFQPDIAFSRFVSDFKRYEDLDLKLPEVMKDVLREYQKTGFYWLKMLSLYGFGGILADDMGLGKTIQVISLFLSEAAAGKCFLVVAPTSLLYNWENEIHRFAPALTTQVVAGLPEKRKEQLLYPADVYITTYDMLKRDIDSYEKLEFEVLIADEAQNIKNPQTQNAKSIKALKAKKRFALTGTPIENALTELWSIFDFIMPGYLHSAHKFSKLYETPIVKSHDMERAGMLRKQIAPFLLRRVKKDVLDELPNKTETNLYAELLPEQRKLYIAHLLKARGEFERLDDRQLAQNRIKMLAELTCLRQICCHPALLVEDYSHGSGKLNLAMETIEMSIESGHRALLFSQFTSMLAILRKELDQSKIDYFYLDGATDAKTRMEMATRFNGGERDLFLISLKAGGTGLNLIGADVVIHYDPWWNPSVMDQASDRAHRYGQQKMVQVFNLVAKDTIEQKILELHDKKKDLVDTVIDENESGQFIGRMSEEDVRELFKVVPA